MAKHSILNKFYTSDKWINLRLILITERRNRCEYCGEIISEAKDITAHHIEELTPENVHDYNISLNPDNILLVHHECHNKIHKRFGYSGVKKVFIVYGPPLAGKSTYVKRYIQRCDIVIDMDRLYEGISMLPYYDKPNELFYNVMGVYNQLIDNVKTRYGKWHNAWVVGTLADKYKRDKLANDLGAELIFCNVSKEECIARLDVNEDRQYRKDEWIRYINKWFDTYRK